MIELLPVASLMLLIIGLAEGARATIRRPAGLALAALASAMVVNSTLAPTAQYYFVRGVAAAVVAALALAMMRFGRYLSETVIRVSRPGKVLLLLLGWLFVREIYGNANPVILGGIALMAAVALLLNVVAGMTGPLTSRNVADIFAVALTSAISLGGLTASWTSCRADKCSLAGSLYRGPFPNENVIALLALWLLVFAIASEPSRARLLYGLASLSIVLITGSRTSLVAALVALVSIPVSAAWATRRSDLVRIKPAVALAVPFASAAIGLIMIEGSSVGDLSNRGRRWTAIRDSVGTDSIGGRGLSWWRSIEEQLGVQTFPHSTYGLLLVAGGLIAVMLFVAFIAAQGLRITALSRHEAAQGFAPLMALVVVAPVETLWNPAAVDLNSIVVLALTVWAAQARTAAASERVPRPFLWNAPLQHLPPHR